MIAVDRDPALNVKLVSDPPQGPAKFNDKLNLELQLAPKKTPGKIVVPAR